MEAVMSVSRVQKIGKSIVVCMARLLSIWDVQCMEGSINQIIRLQMIRDFAKTLWS